MQLYFCRLTAKSNPRSSRNLSRGIIGYRLSQFSLASHPQLPNESFSLLVHLVGLGYVVELPHFLDPGVDPRVRRVVKVYQFESDDFVEGDEVADVGLLVSEELAVLQVYFFEVFEGRVDCSYGKGLIEGGITVGKIFIMRQEDDVGDEAGALAGAKVVVI